MTSLVRLRLIGSAVLALSIAGALLTHGIALALTGTLGGVGLGLLFATRRGLARWQFNGWLLARRCRHIHNGCARR